MMITKSNEMLSLNLIFSHDFVSPEIFASLKFFYLFILPYDSLYLNCKQN